MQRGESVGNTPTLSVDSTVARRVVNQSSKHVHETVPQQLTGNVPTSLPISVGVPVPCVGSAHTVLCAAEYWMDRCCLTRSQRSMSVGRGADG